MPNNKNCSTTAVLAGALGFENFEKIEQLNETILTTYGIQPMLCHRESGERLASKIRELHALKRM